MVLLELVEVVSTTVIITNIAYTLKHSCTYCGMGSAAEVWKTKKGRNSVRLYIYSHRQVVRLPIFTKLGSRYEQFAGLAAVS